MNRITPRSSGRNRKQRGSAAHLLTLADTIHVLDRKGDVVPIARSKILTFLSVIALAGTACSQRPSESDARQMLQVYYRERFGSVTEVQVANLKKLMALPKWKMERSTTRWNTKQKLSSLKGIMAMLYTEPLLPARLPRDSRRMEGFAL